VEEGLDVYEDPKKAIELLGQIAARRKLPPEAAPLIYRYYYDWGSLTPLLLADDLGITDVLVTDGSDVVEAESYKYGVLKTNIELTDRDREWLRDVYSRRVAPLSAFRPFSSRFDSIHRVRVTGIAPDVARRPSFAFRAQRVVWTAPRFVAYGGAEPWQMAYLCAAWRRRMHILVIGLPGTGKTSLLNAIISCTQPERRLAIVQSVPELWVPQAAFVATERQTFGAGIPQILMAELVQRFGLRANSDVAINELLAEEDLRAYLAVAFAGFGAAATIHAADYEEMKLRLARMGASEAELDTLTSKLVVAKMEKASRNGRVVRRVTQMFAPGGEEVGKAEALRDPEAAKFEEVLRTMKEGLFEPYAWLSYLRKL
jgi:type IV secretory pathway ATPase VirB11/archaellum biosynthesis ATPase